MERDDCQRTMKRVESVLRDAEGFANQCMTLPKRELGLDREVMALAIHEALAILRSGRPGAER